MVQRKPGLPPAKPPPAKAPPAKAPPPPPRPGAPKQAGASAPALDTSILGGDYRRINSLLVALSKLTYRPDEAVRLEDAFRDDKTAFHGQEAELVKYWKQAARDMGMTRDSVEALDWDAACQTYPHVAAMRTEWGKHPASERAKVVRGDTQRVLEDPALQRLIASRQDDGDYEVAQAIQWKSFFATTHGEQKGHSYADRSVTWELRLGEGHEGKEMKGGYASEQEVTFPPGVTIWVERVIVKKDGEVTRYRFVGTVMSPSVGFA